MRCLKFICIILSLHRVYPDVEYCIRYFYFHLLISCIVYTVSVRHTALPEDLHGWVAVITGGARGIGKEVVRNLLQCNMHVVIGKL